MITSSKTVYVTDKTSFNNGSIKCLQCTNFWEDVTSCICHYVKQIFQNDKIFEVENFETQLLTLLLNCFLIKARYNVYRPRTASIYDFHTHIMTNKTTYCFHSENIKARKISEYYIRFSFSFICQGTSTRRQRSDLFGLRVKLPPERTCRSISTLTLINAEH